jgi:hypothetical protein
MKVMAGVSIAVQGRNEQFGGLDPIGEQNCWQDNDPFVSMQASVAAQSACSTQLNISAWLRLSAQSN